MILFSGVLFCNFFRPEEMKEVREKDECVFEPMILEESRKMVTKNFGKSVSSKGGRAGSRGKRASVSPQKGAVDEEQIL